MPCGPQIEHRKMRCLVLKSHLWYSVRIDNEQLILEARSETIESAASFNFTRDAQPVES